MMGENSPILPTALGVAGRGMYSRTFTHTLTVITGTLRRALSSVPKWSESARKVRTLPTKILRGDTFT